MAELFVVINRRSLINQGLPLMSIKSRDRCEIPLKHRYLFFNKETNVEEDMIRNVFILN